MEIQGKIIAALQPREGTSAKGTAWKVQEFVLETAGQYPKKMVFEVFGQERLDRFGIQEGQNVNVAFDIDAREWNGRWFNSIRAYDVQQMETTATTQQAAPVYQGPQPAPTSAPVVTSNINPVSQAVQAATPTEEKDELPF